MLKKLSYSLIYFFLFLVIFVSISYVHINYIDVDVVLYAFVRDLFISVFIALILFCGLEYYIRKKKNYSLLSAFEILLCSFVFIFAGYAYVITIPTLVERSMSFYILDKMDQLGGEVNDKVMPQLIEHEFMTEYKISALHLTEQETSGNIIVDGDCLKLTEKGRNLSKIGKFVRAYLIPKKKLIMGEYTDHYLRPLSSDTSNLDFKCK